MCECRKPLMEVANSTRQKTIVHQGQAEANESYEHKEGPGAWHNTNRKAV